MRIILSILLCAYLFSAKAQQESTGKSPLKFIEERNYVNYTNGGDESLVLIAEVNGYPSVQKVLDLEKKLNLNAAQKSRLQTINAETDRKIKEMGRLLIAEQTKLNVLFETKKVNEGSLIYHTNKIGALEGEMRNAYLKAYLKTREVLTDQQFKKYNSLKNPVK